MVPPRHAGKAGAQSLRYHVLYSDVHVVFNVTLEPIGVVQGFEEAILDHGNVMLQVLDRFVEVKAPDFLVLHSRNVLQELFHFLFEVVTFTLYLLHLVFNLAIAVFDVLHAARHISDLCLKLALLLDAIQVLVKQRTIEFVELCGVRILVLRELPLQFGNSDDLIRMNTRMSEN